MKILAEFIAGCAHGLKGGAAKKANEESSDPHSATGRAASGGVAESARWTLRLGPFGAPRGRGPAPRKGRNARVWRVLRLVGALALGVGAATAALLCVGARAPRSSSSAPAGREAWAQVSGPAGLAEVLAFDPGVSPRDWTALVLHHSATLKGSAQSFDAYHRAHQGWKSLGYHFVIGNGSETPDGAVEAGPRWSSQEAGAHANSTEFNAHGIGICLVGNFALQPPSEAQVQAACALVRELGRRFHIPVARVFNHGQIREGGATACPGRLFPLARIQGALVSH